MDAIAFSEAVAVAVEMTDPGETLIVVTADHSHPLTISGYSTRGNPILGYAACVDGEPLTDSPGVAYTTLGYANGPGARRPESELDPTDPNYRQRATHPMLAETLPAKTSRPMPPDPQRTVWEVSSISMNSTP